MTARSATLAHLVIEQVADRWHKHPNTVRAMIKAGSIPAQAYFRVGGTRTDKRGRAQGRLLFILSEIEKLEKSWL